MLQVEHNCNKLPVACNMLLPHGVDRTGLNTEQQLSQTWTLFHHQN